MHSIEIGFSNSVASVQNSESDVVKVDSPDAAEIVTSAPAAPPPWHQQPCRCPIGQRGVCLICRAWNRVLNEKCTRAERAADEGRDATPADR